jgi:hypothetical protein
MCVSDRHVTLALCRCCWCEWRSHNRCCYVRHMANDACFRHCTGKTTLLQLIAGKYMVDKKTIVVLGQSPFHDLVCIKLYA